MKRLMDWRHDEVRAVHHEKDLLHILLTMTQKLEEHMTGRPRTEGPVGWNLLVLIVFVLSL